MTRGHTTSNCITTDSACLFIRNAIPQDELQPIAARRKRVFSQVIPQHGAVNKNSNSSSSSKIDGHNNLLQLELRNHVNDFRKNQTHFYGDETIRSSRLITMTRPTIRQSTPHFLSKFFSCGFVSNQSSIHNALLVSHSCYG